MDCEKGLISALIQAPDQMQLCMDLPLDAFYIPASRILFDLIRDFIENGSPLDFEYVKEALINDGQLEEIGGVQYLSEIYAFVPCGAGLSSYLKIVKEKYAARQFILFCDKGKVAATDRDVEIGPLLAEAQKTIVEIVHGNNGNSAKPYLEFLKPSEVKSYQPPPGTLLIGNNHVVRGGVSVVGGPPGVGKSRGTVALAEAGATGLDWIGLAVYCNFRTLIIQNENGRYRLSLEFADLDEKLLDQYLRITPPPPYGLRFDNRDFRDLLKAQIDNFQPGLIVIDPWNAITRDDKQKDYRETFDLVRDVIPAGDDAPHIQILAHTRKPYPNERTNGRALLNLLAGHHILASVPRTVWVYQHASDDVAENRVVITCCKNNDGDLGPRSVWLRDNGLWTSVKDFDWEHWDNPDPDTQKQSGISDKAIAEVFEHGDKSRKLSEAVTALMKTTGKKRSVCYAALNGKGKFADRFHFDSKTKLMSWIP